MGASFNPRAMAALPARRLKPEIMEFDMTPTISLMAVFVSAGLLAGAAPAFAETGNDAGHRYHAQRVETGGDPVYCIRQDRVGTLIPQRTCMTRRGWIKSGAQVIDDGEPAFAAYDRQNKGR